MISPKDIIRSTGGWDPSRPAKAGMSWDKVGRRSQCAARTSDTSGIISSLAGSENVLSRVAAFTGLSSGRCRGPSWNHRETGGPSDACISTRERTARDPPVRHASLTRRLRQGISIFFNLRFRVDSASNYAALTLDRDSLSAPGGCTVHFGGARALFNHTLTDEGLSQSFIRESVPHTIKQTK